MELEVEVADDEAKRAVIDAAADVAFAELEVSSELARPCCRAAERSAKMTARLMVREN